MEWYWYLLIAIAVVVLSRWLLGLRRPTAAVDEFAFLRQHPAPTRQQERLKPELKTYVTSLCRVYATTRKSFASPNTPVIGQEIYDKHGHQGMVAVCDEIRRVLGGDPARDLEYKWNGVGDWRG